MVFSMGMDSTDGLIIHITKVTFEKGLKRAKGSTKRKMDRSSRVVGREGKERGEADFRRTGK